MEVSHVHGIDGTLNIHSRVALQVSMGIVGVLEGAGIVEVEDRLCDTKEENADANTSW